MVNGKRVSLHFRLFSVFREEATQAKMANFDLISHFFFSPFLIFFLDFSSLFFFVSG
jgi:hypothetical protein